MLKPLVRWFKYFVFLSFPAVVLTFLALELVFRYAIPAADPPHAYFDPEYQIFRFDANGPRTGKNSVGNLAQLQANWRVNNMGWLSDIDYRTGARDKPLVAIIGDSFIVALQVDAKDSLPSRLRQLVGDEFEVYGFGSSGAPLSQYLQMSRYVNRVFDPDILVFNVVHNDFDESLCDLRHPLGMLCLRDDQREIRETEIVPYTPSKVRRLARKSSLVRYLFLNLELAARFPRSVEPPEKRIATRATADGRLELEGRIERAVHYILGRIAEENPGKTVIFMIDGPRRYIYGGELDPRSEYELRMTRLLEKRTNQHGFHFVDLTNYFSEAFEANHLKFESKYDKHWNEVGHAVAAQALAGALKVVETGGDY